MDSHDSYMKLQEEFDSSKAAKISAQLLAKELELKKAEEIISQKVAVYHELTVYIESEELSKTSLDKDIAKAVQLPAYLDNIDKIKESVVMMELMAGIEMPAADNATKAFMKRNL